MTIAFFSNCINHHQKLVADELCKLTGGNYTFVQLIPLPEWLKKGGYSDYSQLPYVLRVWESEENLQKAKDLAVNADVAMFGGCEPLSFEVIRCRNTDKLTFMVDERWFKRGWVNIFSPRLIRSQWYYYTLFSKKPVYKLCASAFTATDQRRMFSFKDKCYKWGYFTKVENVEGESNVEVSPGASTSEIIQLMWCSRFLKLKHPELPVLMAKRLKDKGYKIHLDMYGSGIMFDRTISLVNELDLNDVITFCGNVPNEQILHAMKKHEIFLFTSDRNEGWGAVANEAMSNSCVLVGSDTIGSMPFLVKNGVNGFLFQSSEPNKGFSPKSLNVDEKALKSLIDIVEWLIKHPNDRRNLANNAFLSIKNIWSPKVAAKNLMQLIDDLKSGRDTSIVEGPCSKS